MVHSVLLYILTENQLHTYTVHTIFKIKTFVTQRNKTVKDNPIMYQLLYNQERIRGRSVQPIELSEPKVRRVRCKNLPYKEGFCRPHKTAIVALA